MLTNISKFCWNIFKIPDEIWDAGQYRDLPINKTVSRLWKKHNGVIQTGDRVMVVSGRKVPIGTVAKVESIRPMNDRYGRWVADYVYLGNGMRTNITNCSRETKAPTERPGPSFAFIKIM